MQISFHRAKALIAKFHRKKIMVVGDLMLDKYIYGNVHRLSPEAPVPVVLVRDEKNMAGGAANVARNVKALGANATVCGVAGNDQTGRQLLAAMRRDGIGTGNVMCLKGLKTTVKTRVIAERQQVVRLDWDDKLPVTGIHIEKLCRLVASAVAGFSGVILADYAKGIISQKITTAILAAARDNGVPVALDPKENLDFPLDGISIVKPNRKEAFLLAGMTETEAVQNPLKDRPLLRAGEILLEKWKPHLLVITLGAQGMLVLPKGHAPIQVTTMAREVFDVSGAGDTAIAVMLLALVSGANHREAAELANCASGVVVGKIGTATCSGGELLKFIGDLHN